MLAAARTRFHNEGTGDTLSDGLDPRQLRRRAA
jgi:hypothetical protein